MLEFTVDIGYRFEECPHNEDCERKVPCIGAGCVDLKECTVDNNEWCFKKIIKDDKFFKNIKRFL